MALVDYSSSSSASTESLHQQPPAKRHKVGDSETSTPGRLSSPAVKVDGQDGKPSKRSAMPPLPSTFHDLYASTVRQSVVDDPSLHHGRKRQTPHIVGNWPSHLYIEWNPTSPEYDMLVNLVQDVETELQGKVKLHNFLTSDLGSPLPLHISLSRPLSLTTASKDDFLERAAGAIQTGAVGPFAVSPRTLAWYKSPDSDRIFLIIRVASRDLLGKGAGALNPELVALLRRCNGVASQFGQPPLYKHHEDGGSGDEAVGVAFHISIGWTFDVPGEEMSLRAIKVFKRSKYAEVRKWEIDVSAVKAKIGNSVHHIPLGRAGKGGIAGRPEAPDYF
ncbi:unnamed protein product [Clonostachys solani]|uniref:U6 snRNA phosphodiesterase n=1 Tax=Clonostachys solani TaxID=160281 RepID=A0A9N9Z358_9HYPO|nr:unnamed protein product [Clonostachys solani]